MEEEAPHYFTRDTGYIAFLAGLAIAGLLIATQAHGEALRSPPVTPIITLAGVGVIVESNLGRVNAWWGMSLTSIVTTAAMPLAGVFGALVVGAISTTLLLTRDSVRSRLFNGFAITLCVFGGSLAYSLVGGLSPVPSKIGPTELLLHVMMPLAVATAVQFAINVVCLSGMISLLSHQPVAVATAETALRSWSVYPGYAVTTFVFVVLWAPAGLGAISIFPIVAPLLLAQWSLSVRETEVEAHLRTVETLVAAGQASQPMLRGRNAWVDAVSREIGLELRLSGSMMQSLRFAALLHDIGLVAPAAYLPGDHLNEGALEWIRSHPQQGVRMLSGIDFLSESVGAIGHHHERWDGRGYPSGLENSEIPLLARVLAVADAYCALFAADGDSGGVAQVAERSVDAVRSLAGTQFDPECVDALVRAHSRTVDDLAELTSQDAPLPVSGVDPHLPWVSEMFAGLR